MSLDGTGSSRLEECCTVYFEAGDGGLRNESGTSRLNGVGGCTSVGDAGTADVINLPDHTCRLWCYNFSGAV